MSIPNEYITIPLKKGYEADLRPILSFIQSAQLSGSTHQYHQCVNDLMKLRSEFVSTTEPSDASMQLYNRYGDQITSLVSKVPLDENQVRVDFKWENVFDKTNRNSKAGNSLTMASGFYEKVCALFNVAAMQTAVAEQQNKFLDDGLKKAAKLYQQATGIFSYLSQQASPYSLGIDLHQTVLNTLATISLAQAQDIFVRKAITDNMKSAVLAKLAEQCAYLYDEAYKLAIYEQVKNFWPKEWVPTITWKKLAFQALAQHYDACANQEAKKYGIAQARIKNAKEIMSKAASKCNCKSFPFSEQQKMIEAKLTQIDKENNLIFHENVPPISNLPPIEKAALAKPTPVGENTFSADFKDLLVEFVPMAVSQAARACDERRVGVVQKEINRLREANLTLNNSLLSFNLPACVEDISGDRIPSSLVEKSREMRNSGGIHHLDRIINDLPSMLTRCKALIDDSERQLTEEENMDKHLRGKYQGYWTRTPSENLNSAIKQETQKYRTMIQNAYTADNSVKQKYSRERNAISLLSQGEADIENYLPPVSPDTQKLEGQLCVKALRQLMVEVKQLKQDRVNVEAQLKNATVDSLSAFTTAYQKSGVVYEESISLTVLDKVYAPMRDQITKSMNAQDRILNQMKTAMGEFNKAKGQGQQVVVISTTSRDSRLRELASAFECFTDLCKVVEEGTKFYTDLVQLLEIFNQRVITFCTDRNRERDILLGQMPEVSYQQVQVVNNPYSTQSMFQALPGQTQVMGQPNVYYLSNAPTVYNPFFSYQ